MKTNKGTFIFQIALALYMATTIFDLSMFGYMNLFSLVSKGLRYFAYLLLIWKLIDDGCYEPRQLLKYGAGILVSLISYRFTGEKLLVFTVLFLMAITNVYFSDVLKVSLWTNGICVFSIIAACKVQLIPERFEAVRQRRSLGFIFSSIGSNFWLYFVLIYIAYRKEKLTAVEGVVLEGITYYFLVMTNTKSAFAIATAALLMAYLLKLWRGRQRGKRLFAFLIRHITFIGTISFCLLAFLWDKVQFVTTTMDCLLSNRIRLTYEAIQTYGLRLFGQPIEWVGGILGYSTEGKTYNYVDSSYMQIMLSYGIVIILILIIAYSLIGREIVKAHAWYLGLAMLFGAIHSTFDPQFLLFQYNIFLLTIGYLLTATKAERRRYLLGWKGEELKNGY